MTEPTVFIIDDDEAYRDSVRELVNSIGLATEVHSSALEFLDRFDPSRPGCLVLDVRMARMSGLALQERLSAMGARIPIVFISGHGDITMAVKAVKDGAVDFVQKPYREQQLLDAIDEALRRDAGIRAAPAAEANQGLAKRVAALTDREREVMSLALKGLPSKVIAKELAISHRTVEQHRSRLLEKLNVNSITELLRLNIQLPSE
ncbi:response regulator transcription factor [Variovorax saccharolyticus]|uniref:response regulator transcription factor n=1 Tax=Variovorax saccharolyticus TaxID=3053516 RepID=UPI0025760ED5|nr:MULTISPECIES: response regulator [unclassified Variovorax]MDM0021406.1 response regulator [Variovorax sp. J22R187]MDM0027409.1 response regulator [Variovorax sp. J31P216]